MPRARQDVPPRGPAPSAQRQIGGIGHLAPIHHPSRVSQCRRSECLRHRRCRDPRPDARCERRAVRAVDGPRFAARHVWPGEP